ncbi:MAG: beta-lactamase family protein [Alphaproteobacteria bacterium]|nr:beta-lactamase family protein [Alphaproteobacteria bacterium]
MKQHGWFPAGLAYVDQWLAEQHRLFSGLPGLSVAISRPGEPLFDRQYGTARAGGETLTGDHLFRIASHSKTFAAMAVGRLMDQGRLSLDTKLADLLPQVAANPHPEVAGITVGQCLSHVSGSIRDGVKPDFWLLYRDFPRRDELMGHFAAAGSVIPPNSRLKYSNFAYGLVGQAIEAVTGKPYNAFVQDEVLTPLGRDDIGPEYDPAKGPYVHGHVQPFADQPPASVTPAIDTGALSPATGFFSTARALTDVYTALIDGGERLLSRETVAALFAVQAPVPDDLMERSYAFGFIQRPYEGRHWLGHSGSFPGQLSVTLFDPESTTVISILTNSYVASPDMLMTGVLQILGRFEREWSADGSFNSVACRLFRPNGPVDFVPLGERLYVTDPHQSTPFEPATVAEPIAEDRFRVTKDVGFGQFGEEIHIDRDAEGRVSGGSVAGMPLLTQAGMRDRFEEIRARN